MAKKREPFELVIHTDENGTRATGSYRIRHYDDDEPTKIIATEMEAVTLEKLGEDFPWRDFIDPAVQGALLKAEECDRLQAELNSALALLEQAKAATLDRENLINAAYQNQVQVANVAAASRDALATEIKARLKNAPEQPAKT